ncbi:hypothetical protein F5B22DRAFT_155291 [Xylaria bambusicola]|uniref:uncharacterized protein n=1 Tax=Xylaria bambusicola TaxID=326684 RepID=UPI0020081BEE|nr:uncharacterized protein F5B22DRAFT_155291 [Xylaria bambusicola]KAI0526373.1 hypothetical protein F5B22DRAFT_155291 [Xylaria bambusicola]
MFGILHDRSIPTGAIMLLGILPIVPQLFPCLDFSEILFGVFDILSAASLGIPLSWFVPPHIQSIPDFLYPSTPCFVSCCSLYITSRGASSYESPSSSSATRAASNTTLSRIFLRTSTSESFWASFHCCWLAGVVHSIVGRHRVHRYTY